MAATIANIGRLKLAILLLTLGAALIVLTDALIFVALQGEINLVDTYGYGKVPREKMAIFSDMSAAAASAPFILAILQAVFLGYFIFQAVKTLDHLDIEHRFSRLFSGISIFIPFVALYIPWASLGEVRQTLAAIAINGRPFEKSMRAFDLPTFGLGFAWIVNAFVSRLVAALTPNGSMNTAEDWMFVMTGARFSVLVAVAIDAALAIVVILYARSLYAQARAVQRVATTDVFGPSAEVGPR